MGRAGQGVDVRPTSIRITFTLDGKQQRHTLMLNGEPMPPTPANLKYATRLAAEIRDRIRHDTFSMAEYFPASGAGAARMTLGPWLDTWLAAQLVTDSTRAGYRSACKFWKAKLGEAKPLRAIKHSDVLTARASRGEASGKTTNNYTSVLREAFELAMRDGLVATNPVEGIENAPYQRPLVDPFTVAEVEMILADMVAHYPAQVANYVEAKFFTGMRTSESFGIQWPDVDLVSKRFLVHQGIVAGKETKRTKTARARTVFLNSRALAAFERQKAHTYLAGKHVFHDPRDGARWGGEPKFRFYWLQTLKRLKIRHRPPYNTRHTYATMMLMAGMTPAFCAGQMGHSVEIFLGTYSKWIPGAGDQVEMAKLEQRLKEASNG
jgi:integrase